jgi:hypothetical protein
VSSFSAYAARFGLFPEDGAASDDRLELKLQKHGAAHCKLYISRAFGGYRNDVLERV